METEGKPRVKKAKIVAEIPILHSCSQTANIKRQRVLLERISEVTLGNGHKEDGLLFIVRKFVKEQEGVMSDIKEIKTKLSTVAEIDRELEIQRRVKAEREKIINEARAVTDMKIKKSSFTWSKVPVIVGVITLVVIMVFSVLNYNINRHTPEAISTVKGKIDDLGTPVVVNSRGDWVPLPKGDSLKYFRNMEYQNFKDTIGSNNN